MFDKNVCFAYAFYCLAYPNQVLESGQKLAAGRYLI